MKKTYHGSCHCKAVRYEADIDFAGGTSKCNCSICWKSRAWCTMVRPQDFRMIAGEDALSCYQFGSKVGDHLFCKHCGVRPFLRGDVPEFGGKYISIYVSSLDDLEPRELIEGPVKYLDGRNNTWEKTPAETRHL